MLKRIAIIFGAVFVLVGILGFISAVTPEAADGDHGRLFGVFAVDTPHNLVHIISGIVAIACGMMSEGASRTYFKVFGIIYGLVAIMGFMLGRGELMGFMAHNMADAVLHTAISAVSLFLGFAHLPSHEHHGDHTHHHA